MYREARVYLYHSSDITLSVQKAVRCNMWKIKQKELLKLEDSWLNCWHAKKSIQVDCSLFWQLIRNIIELKLNISEYRLSYFGLKWSLIYLLSVTIAVKCRWEIIPCMYIYEKFWIKFQFGWSHTNQFL